MQLSKAVTATLSLLVSAAFAGAPAKVPAPVAPAPAKDLGISVTLGYDSEEYWRGVNFSENWLYGKMAYMRPLSEKVSLNVDAFYGASIGDKFQGLNDASYQRLELGVGAVVDLDVAKLGLGYRWYHQMGDGDFFLHDGHEIGATLSKSLGLINARLGGYYDFKSDGFIFDAAVNSEIKVCKGFSIVPGAGIVYSADHDYWDDFYDPLNGFIAVNLSVAFPVKLCKNATLTPYIAARLPMGDLSDQGSVNRLFGGVSITVTY
jgi:hypothetical protein